MAHGLAGCLQVVAGVDVLQHLQLMLVLPGAWPGDH